LFKLNTNTRVLSLTFERKLAYWLSTNFVSVMNAGLGENKASGHFIFYILDENTKKYLVK